MPRLAWTLGTVSLVAWLAAIHSEKGSAAFFLTPFRVWELMLGAALAVATARRPMAPLRAETVAVAGAVLIVAALCAPLLVPSLTEYLALPACVGTALLIASGANRQTAVARLLSTRPMVGIGLVSYSLYLWHWPLLSFARYHLDRPLQWEEAAGLLGLSLLAAIATYRYVEQPLRQMTAFRRQHVVAAGAACLAVVALAAGRLEKSGGWAFNINPAIRELDAAARARNVHSGKCFGPNAAFGNDEACTFGHPRRDGSFDLAVFGDSHADHYVPAVSLLAQSAGLSGRQVTVGVCPALLGSYRVDWRFGSRGHCTSLRDAVLRFVDENPRLRLAVLAHAWSVYSGKELIVREEGRPVAYLTESSGDERSERRSTEVLRKSLERTLDFFERKGISVLLLGEILPLVRDPLLCLAAAVKRQRPLNTCGRDSAEVERLIGETNAMLADLARTRRNVYYFSPVDVLCDRAWCNVVLDGIYMYRNATHLNRFGGERMARAMRLPAQIFAARTGEVGRH
jgi:hypothetical protein